MEPLFENRYYVKKELCQILSISIKTLDNWMRNGEIEFKKLNRAVRFNGNYLNRKFGE